LERIGKDLGVSTPRAHQLIKALDGKGYIKTLHKGYTGICANTRRVMFDPTLSAADAASISGELAPYQIKQQQEEQKAMEKKQAKRKTRRKVETLVSIEPGNQVINADRLNLSEPRLDDERLVDLQYHTSKAFAHIDADILALAIDSLGAALPTEANIEAAIERLMR
jgi:hypothetical protein